MQFNEIVLLGYSLFLGVMLLVNLLYFFQVFKYRLDGDASVPILIVHILLMLSIIVATTLFVGGSFA